MVGSGSLAAMGVWCLLFEGEGGRGGGEGKGEKKRVSGWPFRNEEARRVKLENKEERREARRRRKGGGVEMGMEMEMEDLGGKRGV